MPLILQSKCLTFNCFASWPEHKLHRPGPRPVCQCQASIPGHWALGRDPAQQYLAGKPSKAPPEKRRQGRKGREEEVAREESGDWGRNGVKVVEQKGKNQTRKKMQNMGAWASLSGLVFVSTALFWLFFKWLLDHPSTAFSPLTGPHICFSHSSRALRSLKVQLN